MRGKTEDEYFRVDKNRNGVSIENATVMRWVDETTSSILAYIEFDEPIDVLLYGCECNHHHHYDDC